MLTREQLRVGQRVRVTSLEKEGEIYDTAGASVDPYHYVHIRITDDQVSTAYLKDLEAVDDDSPEPVAPGGFVIEVK